MGWGWGTLATMITLQRVIAHTNNGSSQPLVTCLKPTTVKLAESRDYSQTEVSVAVYVVRVRSNRGPNVFKPDPTEDFFSPHSFRLF